MSSILFVKANNRPVEQAVSVNSMMRFCRVMWRHIQMTKLLICTKER
jgi:hypothetical protein